MAFSGDLESFSLTDVFQKVSQNQDTGRLLVDDGKRPFHVFFRQGKVVAVSPTDGYDPYIAGLLRRRGAVEEARVTKILKRAGKAGAVLAAFKAGALTETEAQGLLEFYCAERVFDLFNVDAGTFTFEEGEGSMEGISDEQKKFAASLDPGKLLFEGARRADEWKRIKTMVLSSQEVFTPNEKKRETAEALDEEPRLVFDLLDGQRTAADVAALSPESRFTVFKSLALLLEKGLIRPLSSGDATGTAKRLLTEGRHDDAIRVARKGLETDRGNRDLRRVVAEALVKKGEKAKAAGELKLLAFSFVDGGNPSAAERLYREVLDLDPRDFDARERLFDLVSDQGSLTRALKEGQEFADAAKRYGVLDRAQEILGRLSEIAPNNPSVLTSLADIHERAGNRPEALSLLKRAARLLFKEGRYGEAKTIFERVAFLDPEDSEAKARLSEIESGAAEKKARFRKALVRTLAVVLVLALAMAWIVYDWISHMAYARLTDRAVLLASEGRLEDVGALCREHRRRYPFTLSAGRARSLEEKCAAWQGSAPRGGPHAP